MLMMFVMGIFSTRALASCAAESGSEPDELTEKSREIDSVRASRLRVAANATFATLVGEKGVIGEASRSLVYVWSARPPLVSR